MAVNGTNGLPKSSMFTVIFEGLLQLYLTGAKNSLGYIVTLNPAARDGAPGAGLAECGFDGPRLVRKHSDVVVVVGDGKNFQAVASLGDFGAHKESNMIARIRQGDGHVFFAVSFGHLRGHVQFAARHGVESGHIGPGRELGGELLVILGVAKIVVSLGSPIDVFGQNFVARVSSTARTRYVDARFGTRGTVMASPEVFGADVEAADFGEIFSRSDRDRKTPPRLSVR